jgi:pimeloyl-ACP methyl ester carboxylesterase
MWSTDWLGTAAATFDRAVVAAVRLRNQARSSRAESLSHDDRLNALSSIRDAYGGEELWRAPDSFFTPPEPIAPKLRSVRESRHGVVVDASWPSSFEPYLSAIQDKYLSHINNRTARARLYLGPQATRKGGAGSPRPRPAMVLIHGYLAGQWAFEERAWPIAWLGRKGFDVALAVLPFHAQRARTDRKAPPPFPGADPRFTNEGFRQAMLDLRALIRWLRARGAPSVGVMGMSLGGYTASLLATVESGLSFVSPIIPLASIADFARDQGRLGSPREALEQHRALEEATRIVSPFARQSLVPPSRVLVVAAQADQITPIAHAERLAGHFGAHMVRFTGGHLLQFGRASAFRQVGQWLAQTGLAPQTSS